MTLSEQISAHIAAGEAAEPDNGSPFGWRVNQWVKQGIQLGFRFRETIDVSMDQGQHLSAGAQIGGVIEPVGALPVIIEDDVLVGGNTGFMRALPSRRAR